jgi:hypothetical protein
MKIPSPYENYPPGWPTFDEKIVSRRSADFGFAGTKADINRFAARYRASRCFRRVEFKDLSLTHETADGYSALCHLLLTYSAFEYLLRALRLDQHNTTLLLSTSERDEILRRVHLQDPGNALFAFMKPHLNKPHQKQLRFYLLGQPCNPFFLASGIRHLFAHGVLTPNPSGVTSITVRNVSRYLSRVLCKVMDREFEKRIEEFKITHGNTKRGS